MRQKKRTSAEGVGAGGVLGQKQTLEEVSTLSEVAAYLKMTPEQVRELCRRRCVRPIPYLKAGRHLRFSLRSVVDWLTQKQ